MPSSDLILNVKQIAGYGSVATVEPSDEVVLQRGGIGGPYQSATAEDFVGTALATSNVPLQVGVVAPSNSHGGQVFTDAVVGAELLWNAYYNASSVKAPMNSGALSGYLAFDVTGFNFSVGSGQPFGWTQAANLSPSGYLVVGEQVMLGRDPAAPMEAATSQWVQSTINASMALLQSLYSTATVWSFNSRVGNIILNLYDVMGAGGAPIFSPVFQGAPTAPPPAPADSSNAIATTQWVWQAINVSQPDLSAYAPLAGPAFSGAPTAPTPPPGTSDGQLATTAFVMNAVTASTSGVSSWNTRTGAVTMTAADITAAGGAVLASPAFTGVPTAPTPPGGVTTAQIATCGWVMSQLGGVNIGVSTFNGRAGAVTLAGSDITAAGGLTAANAVTSFNNRTGAVSLIANDISAAGGALLASPTFTGVPAGPTAAPGTNGAQLATTAFVTAAVNAVGGVSSFNGRNGVVTLQATDVTGVGGALLASPALTGVPTAPTAAANTNTTQLATCAYVQAAITAMSAGVASFNGRTGVVTLQTNDITGAGGAVLTSPAFSGAPTAPTATAGTNTTQLATTAFVAAAITAAGPYVPIAGNVTTTGPVSLKGVTDGSSAAAGQVGEYQTNSQVNSGWGTGGNWTQACTLSLTAGDWDVWGHAQIAGAVTTISMAVNTTGAAPSGVGFLNWNFGVTMNNLGASALQIRVSSASTVGVSLMVALQNTVAVTVTGYLYARRMR